MKSNGSDYCSRNGHPSVQSVESKSIRQIPVAILMSTLSIKTEAVIKAILLALWSSVNRTQYLLSVRVSNIPQDGANPSSALQFIQMSKLTMSVLERCRQQCGRRIFAAGAQASNGVEDLWTYGVNTTEQLETLYAEGVRLLAAELYVLIKCASLFKAKVTTDNTLTSVVLAAKGPHLHRKDHRSARFWYVKQHWKITL